MSGSDGMRSLLGIVLAAFALASATAEAATYFARTNNASTAWENTLTWSTTSCTGGSPGTLPGAGDDVQICNNKQVTITSTRTIGSLTVNIGANTTSLTFTGTGNLTVTNASGRTGNVTISAPSGNVIRGIFVNAGTMAVTGSVDINAGSGGGANHLSHLSVTSGTVTIGGNVTIDASTTSNTRARMTVDTGKIDVTGNVTLTGGGANSRDAELFVTGASVLGNGVNIGGTLTVASTVTTSSTVQIQAAGGRITVSGAGGVVNRDSVFIDDGIFTVSNVAATFATNNPTDPATTRVTGGTLTIAGNATVTGGGTNPSPATMTVSTGTISVAGNLTVTAGTNTNTDATAEVTGTTGLLSVTGDVLLDGTNATRNAIMTVSSSSDPGKGVTIGGSLTVGIVGSTATGAATAQITASGGRITVNGAGGVNNRDTITVGDGIFTVSNAAATFATTNNTKATSTSVTGGTLAIAGAATVAGGTSNPSGATLTVSTGTISIGTDLGVTAGGNTSTSATASVTSTGKMDVGGNVTTTGGAAAGRNALLTVGAASAVGQGINITGNLTVSPNAVTPVATTSTASITAAGGRITVAGASGVSNGDQVLVDSGIFSVTNGAATFATTHATIATTTRVTGGTLDISGGAAVTAGAGAATFTVATGTINAGSLTVTAGGTSNITATASVTGVDGLLNVTNNATLTGGTVNTRDALLTVGASSAVGKGIIIGGTLNVSPHAGTPVATSSTASITAAGGRITVNGAGGVSNGDTVSIGAGIFTVSNSSATYANSHASIVANTTLSTGSLTVEGTLNNAAGEQMQITSTGSVTVGNTTTYAGTLTNAGTVLIDAGGTVNANGAFTSSGTYTNTLAGQLFLRGATSTIDGTFNRGTGTVTMNGAAAQSLSGTAINGVAGAARFNNLVINNSHASGVTLGSNVRVEGTTTFTLGNVTTGSNVLSAGPNCSTPSVVRTSGHVVGNLQKTLPNGSPAACEFQVGTGTNYAPALLTFSGIGGAGGGLIVSTTAGLHANIATSGLNAAKSVNRWWRLTTTGAIGTALPAFTSFNATFTFINPGDILGGGNTGAFEIERWNGATWSTTTVGARTGTSTEATGITALGDFADGEKTPPIIVPDSLNAFETSTGAGQITGKVYTKVVGSNFSLDVVAILTAAQHNTFNETVQVDLVTGATAPACGSPTPISPTLNVNMVNGRATTGNFNIGTAYRNVRVRITYAGTSTVTNCSSDNFSIRPANFSVSSSNATNNSSGAGTTFKTGASFHLAAQAVNGSVAAVTGYDGTPQIDNGVGMIVGSPTAGALGGAFSVAPVGTGLAEGGTFYYSEVGNFGLAANAVHDAGFTSVDSGGADCNVGSFVNAPDGSNKVGCSIGSIAIAQTTGVSGFGRFIPDNFNVTYTTPPIFGTTCGTFTYVGQAFTFPTAVITVTARNGTANGLTNATAVNYQGAYAKLTTATLNVAPYDSQAGRYTRFDALGGGATPALVLTGLPNTNADPAVGAFASGVGTLTFAAGSGISFNRSTTTPSAAFDADIALALNVVDGDNVVFGSNPASFGAATSGNGNAFSGGKAMRYGRLRLQNVSGSQLHPLLPQIEAQYWDGKSFLANTADNCSVIRPTDIAMGPYTGTLTDTPKCLTAISGTNLALSAGRKTFTLTAPGGGINGSVTLTPNLAAVGGNSCSAVGSLSAPATAANPSLLHLQGNWGGGSFNQNPAGRATFGIRGGSEEVIFHRENF
jgi:hypothetical protein